MRVKPLLFVIVLFFLSSCTYEQSVNDNQGKPLIFIVDNNAVESEVKTFVIGERNPLSWVDETKSKRHELNTIRALRDYEDEQEEFEFKSRFANVRRIIENDFGQDKLIVGYEKELDNPDFKEVDS